MSSPIDFLQDWLRTATEQNLPLAERMELLFALEEATESEHRRLVADREYGLKSRGMTWGGVITIVWLAGSIALGIGASDAWAGVVLGTADLVPLAAIFVLQKARKPGKEASKRDLPRASRPPNRLDD